MTGELASLHQSVLEVCLRPEALARLVRTGSSARHSALRAPGGREGPRLQELEQELVALSMGHYWDVASGPVVKRGWLCYVWSVGYRVR